MFVPVSEPNFNMAHHENSHDDHGHDTTEGNRQYYPQGWYMPLVGLFVVALIFAIGAGALLGISGSDKWGKHEVCHTENCDGHCGMDHEKEACCAEGKECEHHGGSHDGAAAPRNGDSIAAPSAKVSADSANISTDTKPDVEDSQHEGHTH